MWLMLLAPVLNRFVESVTKKEFILFLLVFFLFVCGVEWGMRASDQLQWGYSVLSFVGMYFLGRYVRIYGGRWCKLAPRYDLLVFFGATLLSALIVFLCYGGIGACFGIWRKSVDSSFGLYVSSLYRRSFVVVSIL